MKFSTLSIREFSNRSGPGVDHIIFWASTILSFKILKRGERELTGGKLASLHCAKLGSGCFQPKN